MAKLKKSPKNLELDMNVAKNGQFHIFPWQAANTVANGEFHVPRNTAGPDCHPPNIS